jgi:Asp-tRNA(Asn)/Glu-tRNA(Gln) amidotransferase A subunit family amidase
MPIGLQIMSDHLSEGKIIQLGSVFEVEKWNSCLLHNPLDGKVFWKN